MEMSETAAAEERKCIACQRVIPRDEWESCYEQEDGTFICKNCLVNAMPEFLVGFVKGCAYLTAIVLFVLVYMGIQSAMMGSTEYFFSEFGIWLICCVALMGVVFLTLFSDKKWLIILCDFAFLACCIKMSIDTFDSYVATTTFKVVSVVYVLIALGLTVFTFVPIKKRNEKPVESAPLHIFPNEKNADYENVEYSGKIFARRKQGNVTEYFCPDCFEPTSTFSAACNTCGRSFFYQPIT